MIKFHIITHYIFTTVEMFSFKQHLGYDTITCTSIWSDSIVQAAHKLFVCLSKSTVAQFNSFLMGPQGCIQRSIWGVRPKSSPLSSFFTTPKLTKNNFSTLDFAHRCSPLQDTLDPPQKHFYIEAVLSASVAAFDICQYPLATSKVQNDHGLRRVCNDSWLQKMGVSWYFLES